MITVVPALLEKEFSEIEKKLTAIKGMVEWVQVDIADNTFVPNTTFLDPKPFAGISGVNLELHMMVNDPLKYVQSFMDAGFKRFIAHVEVPNIDKFILFCEEHDVEVGLAVDGKTDVKAIYPYIEHIDVALIMGIDAGFSGRPFREDTVTKIKTLHEAYFDLPIEVDGSMNDVNAKKVVEAGATRINSNSFIFGAKDVKIAIETLKNLG